MTGYASIPTIIRRCFFFVPAMLTYLLFLALYAMGWGVDAARQLWKDMH